MSFLKQQASAKIDSVLPKDDPVLIQFERAEDIFTDCDGGDTIYIAFETKDAYSNEFLSFLYSIVSGITELKNVSKTIDMFSASTVTGAKGEIRIDPFIDGDDLPLTNDEVRLIKKRIFDDPLANERLVSRNGNAAMTIVNLQPDLDDVQKEKTLNTIKNLIFKNSLEYKKSSHPLQVHYAGDLIIQQEIAHVQSSEGYIFPLMISVLVIILFILFRSVAGVIIPCAIMMISVTTTLGLKSLFGSPMTTIDPMIYALITTISVADSIHFVSAYYTPELYSGLDKRERIAAIMEHSLYPCFLTSITTATGFAAIACSSINQLKSFGLFAAAGVAAAFIYTVILVGPLISVFSGTPKKVEIRFLNNLQDKYDYAIKQVTLFLSRTVTNSAKKITAVFALFTIILLISSMLIRTGTDPYSFLKDTNRVNRWLKFVEANFGGIDTIDIILESDRTDYFKQSTPLIQTDRFIMSLAKIKGIKRTDSIVSLVKQMNRALLADPEDYRVPHSDSHVAQLMLLFEMSDDTETLYTWVNSDYSAARIRVVIDPQTEPAIIKSDIIKLIDSSGFEGSIKSTITGPALLWDHVDSVFIRGQLLSLLVSLVVISFILLLIFKSVRLGLCAIAVNIFPIICGLGFMGVFGIALSMGTVMITPIAIGIAVDDTIHFIFRYKKEIQNESAFYPAVSNVFDMLFRPIAFTSLILTAGFLSNTLSAFKPNSWFGLVSSIVIIIAMLTDLLLLPSLINLFGVNASNNATMGKKA
ncbi:MAG: MMPL family transporter [Spirochaetes bacterium]|nr:MMPL family transporter [Spirochaetota bacterium]